MNRGFWDNVPKPFFVLAPMYDVTDTAFRSVLTKVGKPDVFFTEFVSADGLTHPEGRKRLEHHLKFEQDQRPIVAQLFGKNPDAFFQAAGLVADLGFEGLDLNCGCPDKNMIKQGSCAALFKNPTLAKDILRAMREGGKGLPVSVKIRIGDSNIDWEQWVTTLLEAQPAAITIHLRTRKEMSKVPAHWEEMTKIVKFVHNYYNNDDDNIKFEKPLIIGNGDVESVAHGIKLVSETNCDGIMIGRGIFTNPWLFSREPEKSRTVKEKLELLKLHTSLYQQNFSEIKSDQILKRFFKIYAHGFDGASELREKLYNADNLNTIPEIVDDFLNN